MNVTYNGPSFKIDRDCEDLQTAFAFLGSCQELFGSCENCENCQGTDLRPRFRQIKGYDFYSIECHACKWEMKFGQKKEGGLFPKGWEPPYENPNAEPKGQNQPSESEQQKLKRNAPF